MFVILSPSKQNLKILLQFKNELPNIGAVSIFQISIDINQTANYTIKEMEKKFDQVAKVSVKISFLCSFLVTLRVFSFVLKTLIKQKQNINKQIKPAGFFAINLSFSYLRFLGPCLTTRRYETAFVLHHFY